MGLYKRKEIYWMSFSARGQQFKRSTGTSDKKTAERIYNAVKGKVAIGKWIPEAEQKRAFTFRELAERYSAWASGRPKTWKKLKYTVQGLCRHFGDCCLNEIDTAMIEQYQATEVARGLAAGGVNRPIATLKHMFTKAGDWDMADEEILKRVRKVKKLKGEKSRLRYLSKEEVDRLLAVCDSHLKPVVIMALNTGCRKGEILKLEWENVDLRHGFISLIETKNGERREIPINDTLRSVLQGITRRLDVPYVFFDNANGKPYGDVKRSFHTALRRAGINSFKFHDLRHTFASHLVMTGVDLATISELLGHKSLTMTWRYAHLAPEHLANGIKKLDNIFGAKEPSFDSQNMPNYTNFRTVALDGKTGTV